MWGGALNPISSPQWARRTALGPFAVTLAWARGAPRARAGAHRPFQRQVPTEALVPPAPPRALPRLVGVGVRSPAGAPALPHG